MRGKELKKTEINIKEEKENYKKDFDEIVVFLYNSSQILI